MTLQFLTDFREMMTEQYTYRELLYQITKRDLLLRYKQTVMGFGWAVFMPLLNTVVFSVVFTRVAPLDVGMPYPLYAYCGLLCWNLSASSLRFAVSSLSSNAVLVGKVYFPREILPLSAILVALVDWAVGGILLVALMAWYGFGPSMSLGFLPLVLVAHIALTAALGLLLSLGNLYYRDVKYLFEASLSAWMFATSVLYPLERLTGPWSVLYHLNPMNPIIEGYRRVILLGESPLTAGFIAWLACGVGFLGWSWWLFHRAEPTFAENV